MAREPKKKPRGYKILWANKNTREIQEAKEAWGNVREGTTIGFGFTSDYLRMWGAFFLLVAEHSNEKPKQTGITFDN